MRYSLKRWLHNYKLIIIDFFTFIGFFWTIIEIFNYFTNAKFKVNEKSIPLFISVFSIMLIIIIIKNKPKISFSYKLRNKDSFIEIKVGDAFKNSGSLVIPINDCFDVSLGGNVRNAKSLQSRLISEFYLGKEEHLETDILTKIDKSKLPFNIGKTIEIKQNEKVFYLLVNSKKKENNRVESSIDDFLFSLTQLWTYIASESERNSVVTIPLICTNHGRIPTLNRTVAIKEIIESYIESSKYLNIADKIIISIYPEDLNKGNINLDKIDEFLKFSCQNYKITNFAKKPEGKGDSASVVVSISR